MTEPYYQSQGPNPAQVRKDVFNYITKNYFNLNLSNSKYINHIIFKIIPDSRNDFGSYRGYYTFDIPKKISSEVIKNIKIHDKAIYTLKNNRKFKLYLQHYLFKPNGIKAKLVAKTTLVGKKIDL